MADIIALGNYYHSLADDDGLPNIKDQVNALCQARFRRIDRFTQLCLLGSAKCLNNISPDTNLNLNSIGLYIGSRFASLSNTISVHQDMMTKGQTPKPAHFINTLSNSAGFYVAKNLELKGKNIFVSRADQSTQAVFDLATMDLASGQIEHALIGVVEESALPLKDQRQRLGVDASTPLAEASHWFLMSAQAETAQAVVDEVRLFNATSLFDWLNVEMQSALTDTLIYAPALQTTIIERATLDSTIKFYQPSDSMNYSPALTAGVLLDFIEHHHATDSNLPQTLITIDEDQDNRFHVIKISKDRIIDSNSGK